MKKLEQTWRWYGPEDSVSLQDIQQAGASGIVSALHHVPHGEIWTKEEILTRKNDIEKQGLKWSVVESLPIHEAIKTASSDRSKYLENYKISLQNLAECGLKTICYNFMPVLDWTRTQLDYSLDNKAKALYFDWVDLAIFDIHLLKKKHTLLDYSPEIAVQANERYHQYSAKELEKLQFNILMGIPGEKNISLEDLQKSISIYESIGREGLKENLLYFLKSIAGICEENGIKMTLHPDDPPYPILGLPRIASCLEDFEYLLQQEPRSFNGICFCTGSLGASLNNNIPEIFKKVKDRVYFLHLRNVKKDSWGNFYEADHLDGDVDMVALMKLIIEENQKRSQALPFRPDHGHQILDDMKKTSNPGYSAIGRLKGLAELRGLELGLIGI
ncbi:mannonate dehydratase [Elizabethkingia sp. JS20170427COW]|uniref:mannonate dehydratase n=1 Tax=Elizabethkingia sp. JS20170427COW TaxID=2583851 RepID=UPI0011103FEC|nr:mannonate dehydratase [Elizabethkingia sp. JS20170427COW]QCX52947.1 mannonate dehydratase [Elizabethkingia sp. JS20170427COW]